MTNTTATTAEEWAINNSNGLEGKVYTSIRPTSTRAQHKFSETAIAVYELVWASHGFNSSILNAGLPPVRILGQFDAGYANDTKAELQPVAREDMPYVFAAIMQEEKLEIGDHEFEKAYVRFDKTK